MPQPLADCLPPVVLMSKGDWDGSGRLFKVTAPEGNAVSYVYDGHGNATETHYLPKAPASPRRWRAPPIRAPTASPARSRAAPPTSAATRPTTPTTMAMAAC